MLRHGCTEGSHSGVAWVALAQLQLQSDDAAAALGSVAGGMAWVRRRREAGIGRLTGAVLALRLCAAKAHLALGQLDEAEAAVQKLAGTCSEADTSCSDTIKHVRACAPGVGNTSCTHYRASLRAYIHDSSVISIKYVTGEQGITTYPWPLSAWVLMVMARSITTSQLSAHSRPVPY